MNRIGPLVTTCFLRPNDLARIDHCFEWKESQSHGESLGLNAMLCFFIFSFSSSKEFLHGASLSFFPEGSVFECAQSEANAWTVVPCAPWCTLSNGIPEVCTRDSSRFVFRKKKKIRHLKLTSCDAQCNAMQRNATQYNESFPAGLSPGS